MDVPSVSGSSLDDAGPRHKEGRHRFPSGFRDRFHLDWLSRPLRAHGPDLAVGTAGAIAQAYSVQEHAEISDVDAAQAGIAAGQIDQAFQRGEDLVLIKHVPVTVEFEANLDPGDVIWNAGVVDVWPAPRAGEPE
jgi:hypothetical protein